MKKLTLFLLIAALLLSLASCGFLKGSKEDTSDDPAKTGKSDGASDGSVIIIGDTTIPLNHESHHGDMYFMETREKSKKRHTSRFASCIAEETKDSCSSFISCISRERPWRRSWSDRIIP